MFPSPFLVSYLIDLIHVLCFKILHFQKSCINKCEISKIKNISHNLGATSFTPLKASDIKDSRSLILRLHWKLIKTAHLLGAIFELQLFELLSINENRSLYLEKVFISLHRIVIKSSIKRNSLFLTFTYF